MLAVTLVRSLGPYNTRQLIGLLHEQVEQQDDRQREEETMTMKEAGGFPMTHWQPVKVEKPVRLAFSIVFSINFHVEKSGKMTCCERMLMLLRANISSIFIANRCPLQTPASVRSARRRRREQMTQQRLLQLQQHQLDLLRQLQQSRTDEDESML